jgi:hypothetical protein
MDKEEAIIKLEEARDLIVEAQYMIEEILPHVNILGVKNMEILEPVTDIIKILSQLTIKGGVNIEVPVEGMYKVLYCDYKKVCEEKKKLQKDVLALMNGQGWDKETASLNLKLLRCEREINSLKVNLAQKEERIEDLKLQKSHLKRQLKELTNNEGQTQ